MQIDATAFKKRPLFLIYILEVSSKFTYPNVVLMYSFSNIRHENRCCPDQMKPMLFVLVTLGGEICYYNLVLKGKLADKFSICYLECISYYLPMDKEIMAGEKWKKSYNPCIQEKGNQIWKSNQYGFPSECPCDVIRWGFPQ